MRRSIKLFFFNRKQLYNFLALGLFICLLTTNQAFAQDLPPGGDEGGDPVPIDGGLSLLLAAGAAYGAKKVYAYRNEKKQA
ncbi:MAG: hypothetical protein V4714_21780 [Bacteroidota bacterium]